MEDISYAQATAADFSDVVALLKGCALPNTDLASGHLEHFVVCRAGGRLVGTIGIELFGDLGLLRSLAVTPADRGRRIAHELWTRAKQRAKDHRVRHLYLLTTSAADLFSRWGFHRIPREEVPAALRATAEFSELCPSTAVVMTMELHAPED